MQRSSIATTLALIAVLAIGNMAEATCGPTAVCGDVNSSILGEVIFGGVRISFSTDDETSSVGWYAIKRYNCGDPNTCSTQVTTLSPTGGCSSSANYSYDDSPPTPVSQWTYTVEVWRADNTRACAVDVVPQ